MRHAWLVGFLLVLAGCSNKVTDSAVDLSIKFGSYLPVCLRVTATDVASGRASADVIAKDALAAHSAPSDRTLRVAVYREKTWGQELRIDVASFATENCTGLPIESRGVASVTLPAQGTVAQALELTARDDDNDKQPATSSDTAIQGSDCNDNRNDVYRGAASRCMPPDLEVDFDCDGTKECLNRTNGQSCSVSAMCTSGHCVDGICCNEACNARSACRSAGVCGSGTCTYPIAQGQACSDGNNCTTNDTCNAQGTCVGSAVTCNTRPGACFSPTGTCNAADGGCIYPQLNAGTTCDDGSPCTLSDKCNASGACVGTAKACNTPGGNPCIASQGSCIEADGGCAYPSLDAGTPCSDGNDCSHTDQCNTGTCSGTAYTCPAPNECQQPGNACAGDGGCLYTVDTSKNGQSCTLGSGVSGTCVTGLGKCSSFPYVPSNFDPDALSPTQISSLPLVIFKCSATFDSTHQTWSLEDGCSEAPAAPNMRLHQQPGGPQVVILSMKQLDIESGKTLTLVGDKPVIFAVYGNSTLTGRILANATSQTPGIGGNTGCGTQAGQDGVLASGEVGGGGGGGGGHANTGASGGRGSSNASSGGPGGLAVTGTPALVPLIGGCPGGRGGTNRSGTVGLGGAGGGAVQLSVSGTLQVKDVVTVSGGGGKGGEGTADEAAGAGGGGSGGGLLLEANSLDIASSARLTANGGGGGEGGKTPAIKGADGADGSTTGNTQAAGGATSGNGAGGDGGAGSTANNAQGGGTGGGTTGAGGGGGASGRIRLVATKSCAINVTTSPQHIKGGACP